MSRDALGLSESLFARRVKYNKLIAKRTIEKRTAEAKLELVKKLLEAQGIPYDNGVTSIEELYRRLSKELSSNPDKLHVAGKIIEQVETEMNFMLDQLANGSKDALTEFVNKPRKLQIFNDTVVGIGTVGALGAGIGLFGNAVPASAHTPLLGAAALGTCLVSGSLTKFFANRTNARLVKSRRMELDAILTELAVTRDATGKIVGTRFDDATIAEMNALLNNKGLAVVLNPADYIGVIPALRALDDKTKLDLCLLVNNRKPESERIDIGKRLKPFEKALTSRKVKGGIARSAMLPIGAAGTIAAAKFAPDLVKSVIPSLAPYGSVLAGPFAGLALGSLTNDITGSKVVGWTTGILSTLAYAGATVMWPQVGQTVAGAMPYIGAISFGSATLAAIVKALRIRHNSNQEKKLRGEVVLNHNPMTNNKHQDYDDVEQSYPWPNIGSVELYNKIQPKFFAEHGSSTTLIIDLVYDYMNERGISVPPTKPVNFEEMQNVINSLSAKDKNDVASFINSLLVIMNEDPTFTSRFAKASKAAGALGLRVVSTLDLFKIFKNLDRLREPLDKPETYGKR